MTVCALIPAYNEEATIEAVIRGALSLVAAVVVVDDGSTDATVDRARRAGATVLRQETNGGKGSAVRAGLAYILERPYTHVLLMDGDLQHHPDDIGGLLDAASSGQADFIVGERPFAKGAMPAARFYSNTIGSRLLSRFIGSPVADSQSGFRLIAADRLRKVTLTARGYEIETEMLIKLVRSGARLGRVPVRLHYEGTRSKLRPIRDTVRTCFLAVRYRYLEGTQT